MRFDSLAVGMDVRITSINPHRQRALGRNVARNTPATVTGLRDMAEDRPVEVYTVDYSGHDLILWVSLDEIAPAWNPATDSAGAIADRMENDTWNRRLADLAR